MSRMSVASVHQYSEMTHIRGFWDKNLYIKDNHLSGTSVTSRTPGLFLPFCYNVISCPNSSTLQNADLLWTQTCKFTLFSAARWPLDNYRMQEVVTCDKTQLLVLETNIGCFCAAQRRRTAWKGCRGLLQILTLFPPIIQALQQIERSVRVCVCAYVYALLCCQLLEGLAFGQEAPTDQSEHEKQMTGCSFPFPQYYTSSPQDPPSTPKPTHACMRAHTHTPSPISAVLSAKTVV